MGTGLLEGLDSLVSKSLLQQAELDREPRFRLLETIREYALERLDELGERPALRRAHAEHFLALAEEAQQEMSGPRQAKWFTRLELEHDNLRAALGASLELEGAEVALRLCAALWRFWSVRGYVTEGRAWVDRALAVGEGKPSLERARALIAAGALALDQDDLQRARSHTQESLRLSRELGDRAGEAKALNHLGLVALSEGDMERAEPLFMESLGLMRELGHLRGVAANLNNLGIIAHRRNDFGSERALLDESLMIFRDLGDQESIVHCLLNLGVVMDALHDTVSARAMFEESLEIAREVGSAAGAARALGNLANMAEARGDVSAARSLHLESLTIQTELGEPSRIAERLEGLAGLASSEDPVRTVRLLAAAESLRTRIGVPLAFNNRGSLHSRLDGARILLGDEAFALAWAEGTSMSLEEALRYAMELAAPEIPEGG